VGLLWAIVTRSQPTSVLPPEAGGALLERKYKAIGRPTKMQRPNDMNSAAIPAQILRMITFNIVNQIKFLSRNRVKEIIRDCPYQIHQATF